MAARSSTALAAAREACGYTQEDLAEKLRVERTTIGRWERGVQSPQPWQRRRLAANLHVSLDELDTLLRRTLRKPAAAAATGSLSPFPERSLVASSGLDSAEAGAVGEADLVHTAIPRLRRVLDRLDLPDDGPTRNVAHLRNETIRANDDRLQSRYGSLARGLPDLIADLARAGQHGGARERRRAAALLTLALRAADGLAFKFGYLDLSARLIDLMRAAAQLAEDPLLAATVAYVRTETFFATGDLDTAARALDRAAAARPAHTPRRRRIGAVPARLRRIHADPRHAP